MNSNWQEAGHWLFTSVAMQLNSGLLRTTPACGQNETQSCNCWFHFHCPNHMATLLPPISHSSFISFYFYKVAHLIIVIENAQYLRNRKHVPCFYWVIQTGVEVWEKEKCCGNTSRRRVFPQLFQVLPNFHECLVNSRETWSTCFLLLLENTATRKRKTC